MAPLWKNPMLEQKNKNCLKIDIHTHILPKNIPNFKDKFGYGGFIKIDHHESCGAKMLYDDGKFFREIESNVWDPKQRIKECDDTQVNVQVLSTVPVMFNYWAKPQDGLAISQFLNDDIAETVSKHPKRFVGLGTLPLQDSQLSIRELERCIKKLGLKGVEIGSHVNGWNLDHEKLFPIFEAASDLGAAIFVHPWDMLGKERMNKYWLPWLVGMPAEITLAICSVIFGGVLEKLPKLKIAFAHGGGAFGATVGRIEQGFKARPDLCAVDNKINPKSYLGKFYVDSLTHDPAFLKHLIQIFGENRIMMGTDYPFPLGETSPQTSIDFLTGVGEKTLNRLYSENALEWLDLKKEHFL